MDQNKDKTVKNDTSDDTSSEATLERGKKAIAADQKLTEKDPNDPAVKAEQAKDAAQWRNEG